MKDKFFEYKKKCFIKLSLIESLHLLPSGNRYRGAITMRSGDVVFCDYDIYLRLLGLLSKIQLDNNA